ncbi:MAG: LCP family protein [Clostridiales bacterium]|nr:LCP family protein [Clostridiales bacterium]
MTDSTKNKIAIIAAGVAVVALAAGSAVYMHNHSAASPVGVVEQPAVPTEPQSTFEHVDDPNSLSPTIERLIYYNGAQYRYREDIDTLLIIGTDIYDQEDNEEFRCNSQADLILVVVFDNTNQKYNIIQINRDTITGIKRYDVLGQYAGIIDLQIALSHSYGTGGLDSCRDTAFAVSRLLYDTDIDSVMSVTMGAVPAFNDLVGGVDVYVEDNFRGVDNTLVQGQINHLEGDHALTFVRARMGMADDSSNINRMSRQRTYMVALMEALGNCLQKDPDFVVNAYSQLANYIVSDISTDEFNEYAERFVTYEQGDILVPEGESVEGDRYMEFYVDEDALQQLIVDTFYEPA